VEAAPEESAVEEPAAVEESPAVEESSEVAEESGYLSDSWSSSVWNMMMSGFSSCGFDFFSQTSMSQEDEMIEAVFEEVKEAAKREAKAELLQEGFLEEASAPKAPAFLGCFKDERDRDMPNRQGSFKLGERETCFDRCRAEGFQFAGLQWKGECWCGNDFGKYGEASADQCACEAGSTNFGKWHQCIYDVKADGSDSRGETDDAPCGELTELTQLVLKGHEAWLDGLVVRGDITEEQKEWMQELFQKKAAIDSETDAFEGRRQLYNKLVTAAVVV
jgi:hypothetical protein